MALIAHDPSTLPGVIDQATVPAAGTVLIGTGRFGEIRSVARLHRRCFPRALSYRTSTIAFLLLMPNTTCLVARVGGRVVGNVIGDYQSGQSRVISICVDPDWRQQGIGSRLLTAVERALPFGNLILMVEATNVAAQSLYRTHGYLAVGESRNYYGRNKHGIWMQKPRQ